MIELSLKGTTVVTGAGQGIGKAIAVQLLKAGCAVIAIGRTRSKLEDLAEAAGVSDDRVHIASADIRDFESIKCEITAGQDALGPVTYLVNAAGVLIPSKLLDASVDDIRETIEINFTSTLILTQIVSRFLVENKKGAIVTIGSNSGTTARTSLGAYPASKAALNHAMKCLGLELAEYGIRCNTVSPGSTDTEMQRSFQSSASNLDKVIKGDPEMWRLGIPLGRMADPKDIANVALFLLSDMAQHITMENIVIDGGATLGGR